jgi:predicted amidophosphoribosyltransferase
VRLAALLAPLAPRLCAACGEAAGTAEPLCGPCRGRLRWLGPAPVVLAGVPVWAPVAYDGPARDLVRALKFGGAWGTARVMAAQIAANAPSALLEPGVASPSDAICRESTPPPDSGPPPGVALVPVPLHPRRLRRRGYDQALLLARALAERTGLPVRACLRRTGSSGAQVGRGRGERLSGPPGSIGVSGEPPLSALLVDDVVTTGGTLAACAEALRAAGARHVAALAYARTPGR